MVSNHWTIKFPNDTEEGKFFRELDDMLTKNSVSKRKTALPGIQHIQFNEKTGHTAIIWDDGSESTVVRCSDNEKFERYNGFCAAIAKKIFGSTSAVKKMIEDKDVDAVKARREAERLRKAEEARKVEAENRERNKAKKEKEYREAFDFIMKQAGDFEKILDMLSSGDTDGDTELVNA